MAEKIDLTIMTFNLRFGLADDGENDWANRRPLVEKMLHQYPTAFIGFQESNHFQMEFLTAVLADHDFIGWHNRSVERWQSDPIYYRRDWKCLRHQHRFLSETPEMESRLPGSKWPRQCVLGLFEKKDRQVILANTHFDFDEGIQKRSAEILLGFLEDYPQNIPVAITGDFNTDPESRAYSVFMDAGFSEVCRDRYATTFHEFSGKETGRHIDWILYRGDLTLARSEIIIDSFAGRFPSDHYPVLSRFVFDGW